MFTEEEVIAFLMAEKVLENHADLQNSERFKSAMFKVRAVLRNAQKKALEDMEESIAIKHKNSEHNFLLNNTLPLLIKAISEKITLRANYATEEGPVERDIEPIGIFHENGTWNAIAYCHLLKDYRHFRVERILALSQTSKAFHKQHKTLAAYLENAKPAEKEGKTHTRMVFEAPCIQAFSRWYVTFGDHARIVEAASLKVLLKERLEGLLKVLE